MLIYAVLLQDKFCRKFTHPLVYDLQASKCAYVHKIRGIVIHISTLCHSMHTESGLRLLNAQNVSESLIRTNEDMIS